MFKQRENYESDLLSGLLSEITPEEQEKTNKRMLLAARIDKAREKKGWSRKELAAQLGKRPSEISKWLSGTHNFTTDTLFDLERILETRFIHIGEKLKVQIERYYVTVSQPVMAENCQESPIGIIKSNHFEPWAKTTTQC